jgi:YbbR domain-containing protein
MQDRPTWLTFVQTNFVWMIGSLILATVVWYLASSAQNPVEQRRLTARLPINVQTDEGMIVISRTSETAQVTIRAPRSVWDILAPDDVSVTADLTKRQPGKYTIPLGAALSNARHGLITAVQPSQITVEIARRAEQLVSVNVVRTADPPPGFVATATSVDVTARIVGPETSVKRVVAAEARINLQDQKVGFSRLVALVAVDADGKTVEDVEISPSQVTLNVNISTRPDVTELSVLPRLTGDLPEGYFRSNYSWEPSTVLVRGDRAAIDAMNGFVYTEPIDLTGKTSTFTQRVKLALPTGVTMPELIDVSVTVEIDPIVGSREFDNVPVIPQGLDPADYSITMQPDRVNVIITGPQLVLDTLTASDISIIAPLGGLSAGKFTVTLKASVTKPGIESKDIAIPNDKIEVTIVALNPTPTPTLGPTRIPTQEPTPELLPTQE